MKLQIYTWVCVGLLLMASCGEDDVALFEKTASERAAEAIASLKADLIAPANGWKIKYRPVDGAGSYLVLLAFDEENKVTIKTDLSADDEAYFSQTISYRIDNSLGIELIFENYSFFSFLFEQDQATFGAEFEFNYVNKTPDNALVFTSKTDLADITTIVLEEASSGDENLLGINAAENLASLAADLPNRFSSSLQMVYENEDLVFYVSIDEFRRIISVSQASAKNGQNVQAVNFSSGYLIQGDSIILDLALQGSFNNNPVNVRSIKLNELTNEEINACTNPIPVHAYSGVTSQNDEVKLVTSLVDANGATFASVSDFYFSPLNFIIDNGNSIEDEITSNIAGALELHMYYGLELNDGSLLYGIGFVIQNNDESITFALREFTPTLNGNNLVFNFNPEITLFGTEETDANLENINIYLDSLTAGNTTYVFQYADDIYEFHNPCTGWSFVMVNAN